MGSDVNLPTAGRPWNETEFERAFGAYYAPVYRTVFRVVGIQQEAEDLAQETFLRLYRHRFSAHRAHNLKAWLFRVATNLAYNSLRRNKHRIEREERVIAPGGNAASRDGDPAAIALRGDERELVRQVLASLPLRQSQLLLLRHAGLSYREVAEVLQVAPGSIGTLLARAEAAFELAYRAQAASRETEAVVAHEGL